MESEKIYRLENASITKALRVTFVQGEGTQENPCRLMWRFYLPDGRYIGEMGFCPMVQDICYIGFLIMCLVIQSQCCLSSHP